MIGEVICNRTDFFHYAINELRLELKTIGGPNMLHLQTKMK